MTTLMERQGGKLDECTAPFGSSRYTLHKALLFKFLHIEQRMLELWMTSWMTHLFEHDDLGIKPDPSEPFV